MLKQRVITALILVAVLLPSLAVEALWPFALLSLAFVSAAGWEWSRLNEGGGVTAWLIGLAVAVLALVVADVGGLPVWRHADLVAEPAASSVPHVHAPGVAPVGFVLPAGVWLVAAVLWVLGGAAVLRWGTLWWRRVPSVLRLVLGVLLAALAWLALTEAKLQGLNFLLSVLCLVWAADIGAYFGGRTFGRRKLAPSISPGKSWEGVLAGMVATLALAALWIWIDQHWHVDSPSVYSRLLLGLGLPGLVVAVVGLTGMSVVGDLFESLIKRQAGQKDSSQLLPGHGGVLDRIDALLPVLPLSLALMSLCHG